MSATELLDRSLSDQASAIAAGEADPAELLDACLARIEERSELNAIVATFPAPSREMLAAAPEGPLYGVPIAIKDEWPLPWRAEQFGAPPGVIETAPGESGPYRALRDAGAVIVGVANMHELGASSTGAISHYEPARNPWDTSRCPGGSSSGSGVAVGGRLVAAAVGADGGGSIRYPGAYCGVTGLKPTFGRSAMAGHHTVQTKTIVSGPLATDAAGCRLLGSALTGEELRASALGKLRIGVVRDPLWGDCAEGVRAACETALDAFVAATGAKVVELDSLSGNEFAQIAYVILGGTEDASWLTPGKLNSLSPELSPIGRALLKYRMTIPITLVERAKLVRTLLRRALAETFDRVDLVCWPTVPAVAPPLEAPLVELPSGAYTADQANTRHCAFANLAGNPAITMPVGLDGGLPVGLQFSAAWGRDELLLDAAEALERATEREFVEALPPIAATAGEAR